MNHLTPDELMDGVDRALTHDRHAHLEECVECRQKVEDLRLTLEKLHAADVPEPSPMFWTHFSNRVRQAIAEEPPARGAWFPVWLRWRVVAPLAALSLLIAALIDAVPRERQDLQPATVINVEADSTAPSLLDDPLDDASWQLVSDLAEDMNLDEQSQAGFIIPGAIERATADLEPAERAELLRLLREELGRPES